VFDEHYQVEYRRLMLKKIGFSYPLGAQRAQRNKKRKVGYHDFFSKLTQMFSPKWREDINLILNCLDFFALKWLVRKLRKLV